MLFLISIILIVVSIVFTTLALIYSTKSNRIRQWVFIDILHMLIGILLIVDILLTHGYIALPLTSLTPIVAIIFIVEVLILVNSNVSEIISKISTIMIPVVFLATEVPVTGLAMTSLFLGILFAFTLINVLVSYRIYNIMRGGKLAEYWRYTMYVSLAFLGFGAIFMLSGMFVLMHLAVYDPAMFIVVLSYLLSSYALMHPVRFYVKYVLPVLKYL